MLIKKRVTHCLTSNTQEPHKQTFNHTQTDTLQDPFTTENHTHSHRNPQTATQKHPLIIIKSHTHTQSVCLLVYNLSPITLSVSVSDVSGCRCIFEVPFHLSCSFSSASTTIVVPALYSANYRLVKYTRTFKIFSR